jgi:hypothetical protein
MGNIEALDEKIRAFVGSQEKTPPVIDRNLPF